MKRILLVLALIAMISMVFISGCVQQDDGTGEGNGEIGSLSQDDLDDLKTGLEGLEIDDLGGLIDPEG